MDNKSIKTIHPLFTLPIRKEFKRYNSDEICTLNSGDWDRFTDQDYETITQICNEELVYNWLFREKLEGKPYPKEKAVGFVSWIKKGWTENQWFVFLIRNSRGNIIGAIDIKSNNTNEAEVGYWMTASQKGVMTNALIALTELAKESGYKSLYAIVRSGNNNSSGVLLRGLFTHNGQIEVKGRMYDKFSIKLDYKV